MKKTLKLLGVTLLVIIGFLFVGTPTEASTIADIDTYIPISEDNARALELLKNSENMENYPFSLEGLTTEQQNMPFTRAVGPGTRRWYTRNDSTWYKNILQVRCNELAPVGFRWLENGIPWAVLSHDYNRFTFKIGQVWDSGYGAWDMGYYWRNFGTSPGSFWARAGSLNELLYR